MGMYQCFRNIRGTNYDEAVVKHFTQKKLWSNVFPRISDVLGEDIKEMALVTDQLWVNKDSLKNEENKKLFNNDGKLKNNTKRAKEILKLYSQIINEEGLSDYQDIGTIKFIYGMMRLQGQHLESFVTDDFNIYYKADFNLGEKRDGGLLESISEIEYEEKYLEELRKRDT